MNPRFAVRALGVFQHATMNGHSLAGPEHLAVCELAVERARSWVSAVVEACRGHFKTLADASTRLASAVSMANVGVWVCVRTLTFYHRLPRSTDATRGSVCRITAIAALEGSTQGGWHECNRPCVEHAGAQRASVFRRVERPQMQRLLPGVRQRPRATTWRMRLQRLG